MIYTFDAKGFLLYPVMKSCFEMNDEDVYKTIQVGFDILQKQLAIKKVVYDDLKGALIPNQEKDKFETCFIIDSSQIDSCDYGHHVFDKLIPLLDKESTYSILCGDYIDFLSERHPGSQRILQTAMTDVLVSLNTTRYQYSNQYYLIYINRLSESQRTKIIDGLRSHLWFTGYADVTHRSLFKSYISTILTPVCIKHKNKVIVSHPADYADDANINMRGFPFEANNFSLLSINDDSYGAFLSYKIESAVPDKDDISFSFNALFPKFDSFDKIYLNIADDKWSKYLADKEKGKGKILELLGFGIDDKARFSKEIFKQICANYIYNLRENQFGDLMFNVCIELPTINNHIRKTTVALKYHPDSGTMDVVTIT